MTRMQNQFSDLQPEKIFASAGSQVLCNVFHYKHLKHSYIKIHSLGKEHVLCSLANVISICSRNVQNIHFFLNEGECSGLPTLWECYFRMFSELLESSYTLKKFQLKCF